MAEYVYDDSDTQIQRANRRQGQRRTGYARQAASVPRRTATTVTQRSGSYSGKGMLTALLLVGFVIVAVRVVADYEVQDGGGVKGIVIHPPGQLGPLPILAGLIGSFFFLSFLAAAGGTKAKVAVILGAIIITTLGVESISEVTTLAGTIGSIGQIHVPGASGLEGSGASQGNIGPAGNPPHSPGWSAAANSASAASNALGAFQRLENSPVTGVNSAIYHAFGGTADLITAAIDSLSTAANLPPAVGGLQNPVGGIIQSLQDILGKLHL